MKMEETFILEWSASQECFHIQLLEAAIEANQRRFAFRPHDMYDWSVMLVGTYRECEKKANELISALDKEPEVTEWTH